MTLEQFVATKKWCTDLGETLNDAMWDGEPEATGWLYMGSLYIDEVQPHWPNDARQQGQWHLILEREEWITNDLPDLERRLYEFARSAGYFDPPPALRHKSYSIGWIP
jgi:hypothetical protein